MKNETFGQWLKRNRELKNLSVRDVAKATGGACTHGYISYLENEKMKMKSGRFVRPSIEVVDAIATALDVPIAQARAVAGYSVEQCEQTAEQRRLLAYFDEFPPEIRQTILLMFEGLYSRLATVMKRGDKNKFLEELSEEEARQYFENSQCALAHTTIHQKTEVG
jgi:transcriptional regulator with XRE-family HTH domain